MRALRQLVKRMSVTKETYPLTYMIRLRFKQNPEYITVSSREQFKADLAKLKDEAHVLGGDNFPMDSTVLYMNCEDPSLAQNFARNNVFSRRGLVESYEVQTVEILSENKFRTLTQFYESK